MDIKLLVGMAAITTGVGLSTLTSGAALVHADPPNPPRPCFNCGPGPGGPGILAPGSQYIIPPTGGSAKTGGRTVLLPGSGLAATATAR
jgi:hypothetical protein